MKETERVKIALPSGELQRDVEGFMNTIGMDFTAVPRRYLHRGKKYTN